MKNPIRILIVDDSLVSVKLLYSIIEEAQDMTVVGVAKDGVEALAMTKRLQPDLITMDIMMPRLNGVEATRTIMQQWPTPIIIISSHTKENQKLGFDALEAGALTIIEKPGDVLSSKFKDEKKHLLNTIRNLAEVPVVKRRPARQSKPLKEHVPNNSNYRILALGASTGGPEALNYIFKTLPPTFPIPIVVAQHITDGFLPGLITWLQNGSKLSIGVAKDREILKKGHVYFAPDNHHLTVIKGSQPMASLVDSDPVDQFKPSITALFTSLAENYKASAIGGLLTGMGRDGATGLLKMKHAGALTFAQSEASCVVFGMPNIAFNLNAVEKLIDLEKIPLYLINIFEGNTK